MDNELQAMFNTLVQTGAQKGVAIVICGIYLDGQELKISVGRPGPGVLNDDRSFLENCGNHLLKIAKQLTPTEVAEG